MTNPPSHPTDRQIAALAHRAAALALTTTRDPNDPLYRRLADLADRASSGTLTTADRCGVVAALTTCHEDTDQLLASVWLAGGPARPSLWPTSQPPPPAPDPRPALPRRPARQPLPSAWTRTGTSVRPRVIAPRAPLVACRGGTPTVAVEGHTPRQAPRSYR